MENETPGLEALEKAKDIIFDYSSAYMNENVPESEIYGTRKEKYKEYAEKDSMLYSQLDIIEKELKEGVKNKNKAEAFDVIVRKNVDATRVRLHKDAESYNQRIAISQNKLTEEEFSKVREVIING